MLNVEGLKNFSSNWLISKIKKRRSRTALFAVHVADEKMVEQTKNQYYKTAKFDPKHLVGDFVEKI